MLFIFFSSSLARWSSSETLLFWQRAQHSRRGTTSLKNFAHASSFFAFALGSNPGRSIAIAVTWRTWSHSKLHLSWLRMLRNTRTTAAGLRGRWGHGWDQASSASICCWRWHWGHCKKKSKLSLTASLLACLRSTPRQANKCKMERKATTLPWLIFLRKRKWTDHKIYSSTMAIVFLKYP